MTPEGVAHTSLCCPPAAPIIVSTATDPVEITISQKTYAVIHRLASIGMDQVLDDPQTDPETMARVLDAMTLFSTWNPVTVEDLEQLAAF